MEQRIRFAAGHVTSHRVQPLIDPLCGLAITRPMENFTARRNSPIFHVIPLHRTELWQTKRGYPPGRIPAVIPPIIARVMGHEFERKFRGREGPQRRRKIALSDLFVRSVTAESLRAPQGGRLMSKRSRHSLIGQVRARICRTCVLRICTRSRRI